MTMSPQLRLTLARNVIRRARQLAQADVDWLAALHVDSLRELDYQLEDAGTALDRHEGREPDDFHDADGLDNGLIAVPKDSCEATHPTLHLQCWAEFGHWGPHFISGDQRWCADCGLLPTEPGVVGVCAVWHEVNR